MSNHNVNGLKHFVMDIVSASQENNDHLEVDTKSYLCFVADARAAQLHHFLGHVDTKKRLLALKQSTDLNASHGYAFTEEQSTALYDPAVFGKKDTRDKVLEQGLVRTTRGRNGTTLVHIDVAIAHLIHICPEIEQFVIDTFKQFGRAMLAIQEGRTDDVVNQLDDIANAAVAAEIEAEGDIATVSKVEARKSGKKARRAFTDVILMLDRNATPEQIGRVIGKLTNAVYRACFGVNADAMRVGLCMAKENSARDAMSPTALQALEYAETALISAIASGNLKDMDDVEAELARISPLLHMMSNMMGSKPVIMENTNGPLVRTRPHGTFQGLLPSGASKVNFAAKQLTSEQV